MGTETQDMAERGAALMGERIERLLTKAEEAIDRNDTDQAEAYRILASQTAYLRRREAKELNRSLAVTDA